MAERFCTTTSQLIRLKSEQIVNSNTLSFRVVASQLSDMVTKHLVLTDPLHIRTAAEQVTNHPEFHIPNGVQMLVVYLEHMQYRQLAGEAQRAQNLQMNTAQLTQNGMPFQYAKRKIKRDKSLIFTHIPEEEHAPEQQGAVEQLPPARPKSMRPTHLPLRIKSMQSKELPESGIASINFDETDSYPQFIGRTSVCNTPMTENKVLPVANVMSICANPEDEGKEEDIHNSNGKTHSRRNSLKVDVEKFFQNFISNPNKQLTRRKSSADLQDALRAISKKLNNFTHGLKTDVNRNGSGNGDVSSDSPDFIEDDDKITSRTISDPTYPVFNTNGQQISRSLFQQFLDQYRKLWGVASEQAHEDAELAALVAEFQEFNAEIQKLDEHMRQQAAEASSADRNLNVSAAKTPLDKRSMTLPLKSAGESTFGERASGRSGAGGVPLTPLMAKLSVLALSETTPIEIQTPLTTSKVFPRRSSLKCEDAVDALAALTTAPAQPPGPIQPDGLQRTELYICGQQNMTLLLLMEEGTCQQQQVVQKMVSEFIFFSSINIVNISSN